MDIQIDCSSIYYGLKQLKNIEQDFNSFSQKIGSVKLPSEVTKASLLTDAKSTINKLVNGDIATLIEQFEETKSILIANDTKAALLFDYCEQGIIDENGNFTDVPLLTQDDYAYLKYSQGTVATSGCGITSLCMVASYILGELYTPDDLAEIANADKSSNVGKMTTAADYVGLNWVNDSSTSREDLVNYLKEGKLVICLVKNSTHFLVCTGITEDGKIIANDPYRSFRSSDYDDGYTWDELKFTAGNTWIFDPNANTGATSSAGTVSVSSSILEQLGDIDIDGVYSETVQPDKKVDNLSDKQETLTKDDDTTTETTPEEKTSNTEAEQSSSSTKEETTKEETKTDSQISNNSNNSSTKNWTNSNNTTTGSTSSSNQSSTTTGSTSSNNLSSPTTESTSSNNLSSPTTGGTSSSNQSSTTTGSTSSSNQGSTTTGSTSSNNQSSTTTGSASSSNQSSTTTGSTSSSNQGNTTTGGTSSSNQGNTTTGSTSSSNQGSTTTGSTSSSNQGSTSTGNTSSSNQSSTSTGNTSSSNQGNTTIGSTSSSNQGNTTTGSTSSSNQSSTTTGSTSSNNLSSPTTESTSSSNQGSTSYTEPSLSSPKQDLIKDATIANVTNNTISSSKENVNYITLENAQNNNSIVSGDNSNVITSNNNIINNSNTNNSVPEIPNTRVDGYNSNSNTTQTVTPSRIDFTSSTPTSNRISYMSPELLGISAAALSTLAATTAIINKKDEDKEGKGTN